MSQGAGQGQCLPPLLPHSDEPWPSEGVLAHRLNATKGKDFHGGGNAGQMTGRKGAQNSIIRVITPMKPIDIKPFTRVISLHF